MTQEAISSADLARRYDDAPYESNALEQTHPSRLGAIAALFGMRPAAPRRCRVLELGCGDGANLVPMAAALPGATFVGLDISGRAIARAQEDAAALGLRNITLRQADLLDVDPGDPSLGLFDYVITHGVYAWVPGPVRERILELSKRCLAPQGVAYISYNAYPGCHARDLFRGIGLYHGRDHEEAERAPQARALLDFLAQHAARDRPSYRAALAAERERIGTSTNRHLMHDELGPFFQPFYFHEFMAQAGRHGLQYVGEACFADMQDRIYPKEVQEFLRGAGDRLVYEQYLDFFAGRNFRQTLLTHDDVPLQLGVGPERLLPLVALCAYRPEREPPDLRPEVNMEFRALRSTNSIGTGEPLFKAALQGLYEATPRALSPEELCRAAADRLGEEAPEDGPLHIANLLLLCYTGRLLEMYAEQAPVAAAAGERPLASPVARLQAARAETVTTLWHQNVLMPEAPRRLLQLLDGRRDRAQLLALCEAEAAAGRPLLAAGKDPAQELEAMLRTLCLRGLLMDPAA